MVDLIRSVVAGSALVLSAAASPPAASNPAGAAAAHAPARAATAIAGASILWQLHSMPANTTETPYAATAIKRQWCRKNHC